MDETSGAGRREEGRISERLGRKGERAAARALRRAGMTVIGRRVKTAHGEIDLVALDGGALVVVEVKTTRRTAAAPPAAAGTRAAGPDPVDRVDHRKKARLVAAARALARAKGLSGLPIRFDVVAVRLAGWRSDCLILRQAFLGSA